MTIPKVDASGTIFEQLFGKAEYVEDMPTTDTTPQAADMRAKVITLGDMFTRMVHVLKSDPSLPDKVQKMASLLWDLVGNRITPVALGPSVASIHFYMEAKIACIMMPPNWIEMVKEEPFMQFGALVYNGSHARDYYNKQLYAPAIKKRAMAFEAEYLHAVKQYFVPNLYQQHVMELYPKGLASLDPIFWYESKPYEAQNA